ncbi:MAG: hypothetical protein JW702_04160, partial [Clostridiales bacterium]|nr:hypothetical protein [Clostridiales bacterium]
MLNRVYHFEKQNFCKLIIKKIVRNGFAEAQTQELKVKNEKTMLLSLVMIFHFMLELFQPHF